MRTPALFFFIISLTGCTYHDINDLNDREGQEPFVCDPETSWQNDILPIIEKSCAVSGCHDGISRRDWTNYAEVKRYAAAFKQRTQDRSMPFDGPPLTQEQIDVIGCWVDSGAHEN
ncbi:MAG TPA: hypothetical protein VGD65_16155 [Chryseosolibacter sp.]